METTNPLLADVATVLETFGARDIRLKHENGGWVLVCRVVADNWIDRTVTVKAASADGAVRDLCRWLDNVNDVGADIKADVNGFACPKCGEDHDIALTERVSVLYPLRRIGGTKHEPTKRVEATTAVLYMQDPTREGERCGLYISAEGFDDGDCDYELTCRSCFHDSGLDDEAEALLEWGGDLEHVPSEISAGKRRFALTEKQS